MIDNIIYITGSVITIIFGCLADTILSKIKPINEDFAQLLQARTIIIFTVVVGLNFLLIKSYIGRYRISEADEWQLLIRDGKMVDAGIGAKHFVGLFDRIVRFPSSINKVKFRVETITKEMQGVVVTGFSLWSIHRNDPWKAYKNLILRDIDRDGKLDSNHGNNYVADICTSIIRVNIANLSLNDVLTKRDDFKSKVREELSNQCEGWGAWIETVEISDVQVASKKLFEDLQCEFRNEQKLKAERVRLDTETKLQQEKQMRRFEENKKKAVLETQEAIAIAAEELKKEQKLAENLEAQSIVRKLRLQREETMKLDEQASLRRIKESKLKDEQELKAMEIEGELLLNKQKHEAELAIQTKEDERIKQLEDKNIMVLQMAHTESVYRNVERINLNSFIGDKTNTNNDSDTPASMLPGMGALMATSGSLQVLKTTNSGLQ